MGNDELEKGGKGGFSYAHNSKSPSVPFFKGGCYEIFLNIFLGQDTSGTRTAAHHDHNPGDFHLSIVGVGR